MKYIRPGNTELFLVYVYFLENYLYNELNENHKHEINKIYSFYINKLYKIAGYYDKNIEIKKYMRLKDTKINNNFHNYLYELLESYKNSDIIGLKFLTQIEKNNILNIFISKFKIFLNFKNEKYFWIFNDIFPYINNKKVLIISPFIELIKEQIENKNIDNLYFNYPENVEYEYLYFPYKFHNTGPHRNAFETLKIIKEQILKINFDVALLSCGSDAGILSHFINDLGKDAFYIGGHLPLWFGILSERYKKYDLNSLCEEMYDKKYDTISQYLIENIPEKYRPDKYLEIEMGGYW
jgi:hypothetical protein